jgi:hypothetical protein
MQQISDHYETVAYLPATGHNFWVAFFDAQDFNLITDVEEVDSIMQIEPVVGWIVAKDEDGDVRAFPLAPMGPVMPGNYQWLNADEEAAGAAAKTHAADMFRRRQAASVG